VEGGRAAERCRVNASRPFPLRKEEEEWKEKRKVVLQLRKIAMEILVIAGVVVVWLALQLWILPALGVPT